MESSKVVGHILRLHSVDLCVSRRDLDFLGEGHLVVGMGTGLGSPSGLQISAHSPSQPSLPAKAWHRLSYQSLKAVPGAGKQVAVDAQGGEDTVFSWLEKDLLCGKMSCSASALATCTLTHARHCCRPIQKRLTLRGRIPD